MQKGFRVPFAFVLLALLCVVLYPVILMGSRVDPEASLRGTPPWREQWGPHPNPQPSAIRIARTLAPRLATLARDGLSCALWNPYIGGGRAGWLVSPQEGGTPLTVAAALLARSGWAFTALLTTVLSVALLSSVLLFHRLGASTWAAIVGGLAYSLSGAVSTALLQPSGSAAALGPLVLVAALTKRSSKARDVAVWGTVLLALGWSGPASLPFIAMALVLTVSRSPRRLGAALLPIAIGALLAALALAPRWWLSRVAREPGAPPNPSVISAPLSSATAFVIERHEQPEEGAAAAQIPAVSSADAAFLGIPVLILSLFGLSRLRRARDFAWPAFVVVGVWLAFAPAAMLVGIGLGERPFAALALSVAALAAYGCDRLLAGVVSAGWEVAAGVVACVAVVARLLPAAAQQMPFAPHAQGELPSPLPATACDDGSRLIGLLDTLPPDIGAALALRDARAADLSDEPAYAELLAAEPGGLLPVTGVLSPNLAGLGVRWVLEPLPLRVVSGEIFAAVDVRPARRVAVASGWVEYTVEDPGGTLRIGLPSTPFSGLRVAEKEDDARWVPLPEDMTLAGETSTLSWWALPVSSSRREIALRIGMPASVAPPTIEMALDRSQVSLVGESLGARVWRRDDARGLFSTDPPFAAELRSIEALPQEISVQIIAREDVTVRALVKFRPGLRRAKIDGLPVEIRPVDQVWSAVRVPRGSHRLLIESCLPVGIWALSLLGLILLAATWIVRRRT